MFLSEPVTTPESQGLCDRDLRDYGFVMNSTRAWAWLPESMTGLFALFDESAEAGSLTYRDRGILVTAAASGLGDSYCTLAWGSRLASSADTATAVAVLQGKVSEEMTAREVALAAWARQLAKDPNATTQPDVDRLREAGLSDTEIFAATVYVALRIAFSTVNDAIGARPDSEIVVAAPDELAAAVNFGRPPEHS